MKQLNVDFIDYNILYIVRILGLVLLRVSS